MYLTIYFVIAFVTEAYSFKKIFKPFTNYKVQNSFVKIKHRYYKDIQVYQSDLNEFDNKWSDQSINDNLEKIESVKIALSSLILGTIISFPCTILTGVFQQFNPYWQIQHVALSICLLLFGITYRYAVRYDNNPQLKQGVVGAFAVTRSLSLVQVPSDQIIVQPIQNSIDTMSPFLIQHIPICGTGGWNNLLDCGFPFHVFSISMLGIGLINLFESFISFGGTAYILDTLFKYNILKRFPSK